MGLQRPGTPSPHSLATSLSRSKFKKLKGITESLQVAQKLFPDFANSCFNLLRHKAIMISPELLRANGVAVQKVKAFAFALDILQQLAFTLGSL